MSETDAAQVSSPRAEYLRRREACRLRAERQARRYRVLAKARNFVLGLLVALVLLGEKEPSLAAKAVLVGVPAVLLEILVRWRNRVSRAHHHLGRTAAFYERRLACLEDRWTGTGQSGTRFLDDDHPYALDLDLFGTGSLFELLCTARTSAGEDTLAAWLLSAAAPGEIRERQAAVAELRPRLDLREDLALVETGVPPGADLAAFTAWCKAGPVLGSGRIRLTAFLLAASAVAALAGWAVLGTGPSPLLAVLLVELGFALWLRQRVHNVLAAVEGRAHDLALLACLFRRLESEPFQSCRLRQLRAALDAGDRLASRRLGRLARLIRTLNARGNFFFVPLAPLLLWTTQFALAVEAWRKAHGPAIVFWLATAGEFEALSALAAYAFENRADPIPDLIPTGPCFDAEQLGHPLLPRGRCVPNDVRLDGDLRLLVVSGSNMSGKSTLLRAIGINTVLALAGAPVRARRLRLSPLAVGATLRIQDSLQAGRSRFFAEILRLRQLLDLIHGPTTLLFLLDELLQGTNSHDRRVGAEAVVRSLVAGGAIGLITTHDLALTHIAELLAPRAVNVHFEDRFEEGRMTFDYRLRPGVVRNSNALELLRAAGIEVSCATDELP